MEKIKFVFFGIIMGIANVIPGVSGGTMAIILNFYDRLMESITLNFKVLKKNIGFLIPLGLGVVIGILGLSKVMEYLLNEFTAETYFGFMGIVLGSLPLIYYKAKCEAITAKSWVPFIFTFVLMVVLSFVSVEATGPVDSYPMTVTSILFLFFSMAIATVTMIIPGISGSMILIIIGMYEVIYGYAIANFIIPLLIPILLGAAFGILGGAKLVSFLLGKYQQLTYMAIFGLLVGSFVELFNRSNIDFSVQAFIGPIIVFIIMFIIVYWFSSYEMKKAKKEGV